MSRWCSGERPVRDVLLRHSHWYVHPTQYTTSTHAYTLSGESGCHFDFASHEWSCLRAAAKAKIKVKNAGCCRRRLFHTANLTVNVTITRTSEAAPMALCSYGRDRAEHGAVLLGRAGASSAHNNTGRHAVHLDPHPRQPGYRHAHSGLPQGTAREEV